MHVLLVNMFMASCLRPNSKRAASEEGRSFLACLCLVLLKQTLPSLVERVAPGLHLPTASCTLLHPYLHRKQGVPSLAAPAGPSIVGGAWSLPLEEPLNVRDTYFRLQ